MKTIRSTIAVAVVAGLLGGAALGAWEAKPWAAAALGSVAGQKSPTTTAPVVPLPVVGQPAALAPETTYNFGNMETGTAQSHKFPIRNTGSAPLKVTFQSHTCKCTLVQLGGKSVEPNDFVEVPPGGETAVVLEWTAKVPAGSPFRHGAQFTTNDPNASRLDITVEGEIRNRDIQSDESVTTDSIMNSAFEIKPYGGDRQIAADGAEENT